MTDTLDLASLRSHALLWMIPTAWLFGAGIHILQLFVSRNRDQLDFLADAVGFLAGAAFGVVLYRLT
ncbi:hypothetical protein AN191_13170 [Loktanella sp. 5RATIMAR09]|nr:hypothetical protein AN191_13170 [Loktanella sp. 5RATIMAR09]